MQEELRRLPSVDRLLQEETVGELIERHSHELVVEAVRRALEEARQGVLAGEPCPTTPQIAANITGIVEKTVRGTLCPVINATGVIIHTNLGRAPLSRAAMEAMRAVAEGYSNLEYDLDAGQRGSRYVHTEALLARLTGAEAALVVNNNAAAVMLILRALAEGREVIISRGQLVEIGGGFRIPDVMRQSGARLVEVGTTNRTYARDYEAAIGEETAVLMRVHHSNFRMLGFTHQATLGELVDLANVHGLMVVDDLGSGTLLDTTSFGLAHEPTIQESVAAGADLVTFSGDKLLGGPQAGIIAGREELIRHLKRFPMTRALRVDKTTLAALQATLLHYLQGQAVTCIPIWQMISAPTEAVAQRAEKWAAGLRELGADVGVVDGQSTVGGGSLPGETLPTRLVALRVSSPDDLASRLRTSTPPVVSRIAGDALLLDPRTVLPEQDEVLLEVVRAACEPQQR